MKVAPVTFFSGQLGWTEWVISGPGRFLVFFVRISGKRNWREASVYWIVRCIFGLFVLFLAWLFHGTTTTTFNL